MGNGKAWNSFADAYKGEGSNSAPQPEESLPDMICPAIPNHGERPNFWKSSCLIKQQMVEHEKTCYPHCKGGTHKTEPKFYDDKAQEAHKVSLRKRNKYAQKVAETACEMFKKGESVTQIANALCRSKRLIEMRLTEAGLTQPCDGPSKREQAFKLWSKDPTISREQMMEMFRLTKHTVDKYKREFARKHIHDMPIREVVFNWLDENHEAKTVDILKHFDLHMSTASEYRMKYRRSARYRRLTR